MKNIFYAIGWLFILGVAGASDNGAGLGQVLIMLLIGLALVGLLSLVGVIISTHKHVNQKRINLIKICH